MAKKADLWQELEEFAKDNLYEFIFQPETETKLNRKFESR